MKTLWQDLRFAVRMLARSPGFVAIAVVILALGIGAAATVFGAIDAVLLVSLPYEQPDRLVQVFGTMRGGEKGVLDLSVPTYRDLRERTRSFEGMAVFRRDTANLAGTDYPERITCFAVTPQFWDVLGVSVAIGRPFIPEEGQPGKDGVVLLSHGLWRHRFGGDPAVVGKSVRLDGRVVSVVGVLREEFRFHAPPRYPKVDAFVPLVEGDAAGAPRDSGGFNVLARLKAGVGLAAAREDLSRVSAAMNRDYPEYEGTRWLPRALDEVWFGEVRPALATVVVAVGCVLLVTCLNVGGLLLMWSLRRRSEIAVRMALGASRYRVARQFVTEGLLLALVGAGAGLLLAKGGIRLVTALIPPYTPVGGRIDVGSHVVLFTLATAIFAGLGFGLLLAMTRVGRSGHRNALEAGNRLTAGRSVRRAQRGLVIAEVGLACTLTICAALMLRTFTALLAVSPGFDPRGVFATGIQLPQEKTGEAGRFFSELTDRVGILPGVEAAALASSVPMRGPHSGTYFEIPGRPTPRGERLIEWLQVVSPSYFRVVKAPVQTGRCFDHGDRGDTQKVVMVNQSFARKYWPAQDPVGRRIKAYGQDWKVIGTVGDVREFGLLAEVEAVQPLIYFAHAQYPRPDMQLLVRYRGTPAQLFGTLRQAVHGLDRDQPVGAVVSLEQVLVDSVWSRRTMAYLMSVFGGLALLLALAGVYGLVGYAVSQRTGEFGIRMALGAGPSSVFRLVLRDGLGASLAGIGLGLVGAAVAARLLAGKLYGVAPLDAATFAGMSLVVVTLSVLACYVPARRASRVDPTTALRCE